jgi:RND family efflux transporter MFP subunit
MNSETTIVKGPEKRKAGEPAKPVETPRRLGAGRGLGGRGLVALVVLGLALLLAVGVWNHVARNRAEQQFAQANAETVVNVMTVHRDQKAIDLVLPGSIEANQVTTLYARTNGYLGQWLVDIGDNVKAGQKLAVIETPDVEQQLRNAEGTLNQAKSNFELARANAVRYADLYLKKVIDAQDNDTEQTTYQAAGAAVAAAQANVNLLEQDLSFNQIIAPFDGTITYRFLDVGALVAAGSGSAGTAIYSLAQTDPLRIYVYVPQGDAPLLAVGSTARVVTREYPNRFFQATVTRTAGAIDPLSRTLLTELQIPNKDGALYAGMYGEIEFTLHPNDGAPIIVPDNAFMFRAAGAEVVVVKDNKIHWQTIQVGRDYGTVLECLTGLQDGDMVVVNPTDDLQEGMDVKTQQAPPIPGPGPGGNSQGTQGTQGVKEAIQPKS